jgi:hypothetical protein
MSSWGASTVDESKPKYLTDAEKRDCYATDRGWTIPAGGNPNGEREVIAAIGGLSGATKLAAGTISSVNYSTTSFSKAAGGTISITVNYNEAVDVTGTPQVLLTNDTPARNLTLDYASGTGTNRLTFTTDPAIAANNAATNADDVLTIGVNALSLNSGTIKDKGTNTVSVITHAAGSDTLTVSA